MNKIGICPICKAEITEVEISASAFGKLDSEEEVIYGTTIIDSYTCPECNEEIADSDSGTAEVVEMVWGR